MVPERESRVELKRPPGGDGRGSRRAERPLDRRRSKPRRPRRRADPRVSWQIVSEIAFANARAARDDDQDGIALEVPSLEAAPLGVLWISDAPSEGGS